MDEVGFIVSELGGGQIVMVVIVAGRISTILLLYASTAWFGLDTSFTKMYRIVVDLIRIPCLLVIFVSTDVESEVQGAQQDF